MEFHNTHTFLCIPKASSTMVENCLLYCLTNKNVVDKNPPTYLHYNWEDIKSNVNENTILFTIIRNPFDWYVSYYFHEKQYKNYPIRQKKTDFNLDLIIADFRDWVKNNPGLYKNTIKRIVPQDKQVTYLKFEDRDSIQNYIDSIAGCHCRNPDRLNMSSIKFSLQTLYRDAPETIVKNNFYNDETIEFITTNDSSVFTTHNYEKTLPIIEETPVVESSIVVERDLSGNIIPPFDPNNPGPINP